ncbi:MAG: ABC transporter ATP-binding protein [Acidimicrobiia bacterium]|jgi:ABC-type multidrug transport system ATPase subunit|nr:MAG: ABC transporter ATP-binding protein [Acidimicrobiia bacterium]
MIRLQGLTKYYGANAALRDVDLDVAEGTSVALWGHNGAGKTTVIRALLGLVRYEGTATVDGHDCTSDGVSVRSLIGHVPQELTFHEHLTVAETVDFSRSLRQVDATRAMEVLEVVGLHEELKKPTGALSGGMRQRLAIALALLADPPVLLLDEPTSNLDAHAREQMVHLLQSLRERCTLLLTTHHAGEVGLLADEVVYLEDGEVRFTCAPSELDARVGVPSRLHLTLDTAFVDPALAALTSSGIAARRNGTGVIVEAHGAARGRALSVVIGAGIDIDDVEVWR